MEDYKKKYETAIKQAKEELKACGDLNCDAARQIFRFFPELQESEDERIRKSLIKSFKNQHPCNFPTVDGFSREQILSWLEKQGTQKQVSVTDEWIEDYWQHEKMNNPHSYDKGDEIQFDHDGFVRFCKKYCKKPIELPKGEDYGIDSLYHAARILEKTLGDVEGYQSDDGILEHKCAIEAVNRLYKQKPTWSEEDEKMLTDACIMLDWYKGNNWWTAQYIINWLKSLKERMKGE